ncbi:helix-turn-helix domain-containing protein [Streptomyces chartreusis]|uniref:helix-turn-helix domain-containing protein n=1 Tax=Streptomyces chartreusis TaxID=1969 RepID=UPI003408F435
MQLVKPSSKFVDVTSDKTVSDVVADRVRKVRRKRGLTAQQLAQRCAVAGFPDITAQTLSNIETGRRNKEGERRRFITVEELMALAVVLEVAPVYLLVPPSPADDEPLPSDAQEQAALSAVWQRFIRGEAPLPGMDPQNFLSEVPREEFRAVMDRIIKEGGASDG